MVTLVIDEKAKGKEIYKIMSKDMSFNQMTDLYFLLKKDIELSNVVGTQCCYDEEEAEEINEKIMFEMNIKTNVIDIHEFIIKNISFMEVLTLYSLINNKIKNMAADWYSSITDEGKNI